MVFIVPRHNVGHTVRQRFRRTYVLYRTNQTVLLSFHRFADEKSKRLPSVAGSVRRPSCFNIRMTCAPSVFPPHRSVNMRTTRRVRVYEIVCVVCFFFFFSNRLTDQTGRQSGCTHRNQLRIYSAKIVSEYSNQGRKKVFLSSYLDRHQ